MVDEKDLVQHHSNLKEEIERLSEADWLQFHADERSFTIGNTTYSYNSQVQFGVKLPVIEDQA